MKVSTKALISYILLCIREGMRIFSNYSLSPNELWVSSPWGRKPKNSLQLGLAAMKKGQRGLFVSDGMQ